MVRINMREKFGRFSPFRHVLISFAAGLACAILFLDIGGDETTFPLLESRTLTSKTLISVAASVVHRDFLPIGLKAGTDKVLGAKMIDRCLKDPKLCENPDMINPKCRTGRGRFYHTMYNKWLGPYSGADADPFQFLEIGFYNGKGFDAFKEYLPQAEAHSIEVSCLEGGSRQNGQWPWGNTVAKNHPRYEEYLKNNQLHCSDTENFNSVQPTWENEIKKPHSKPHSPPLKIVVDGASSYVNDYDAAKSLFFWFPRIEPGGFMIVEDIRPTEQSNKFRTHVLPQIMKDLHYCGDPKCTDQVCFPTLQPLLQSVHCEMHICVFERNDQPSIEYDQEQSTPPEHVFNATNCLFG